MGWGGHGYGWGMGGWTGGLFMVLFWAAVIILIVLVVRQMKGHGMGSAPPETRQRDPVEILRERYARGEIDTGEFEERMKNLAGRER